MSNPIYLAVDLPDLARATALVQQVRSHIGGVKLGLEFFCAHGHHGVREMMKFDESRAMPIVKPRIVASMMPIKATSNVLVMPTRKASQ